MARINSLLYFYAAIIMEIMLIGNITSYFQTGRMERSVRLFFYMLVADVLMLSSGGIAYHLLMYRGQEPAGGMEVLFSGVSDFCYFAVVSVFVLYLDTYGRGEGDKISRVALFGAAVGLLFGLFWFAAGFGGWIYSENAHDLSEGSLYFAGQIGGYMTGGSAVILLIRRWTTFRIMERISFVLFIIGPLVGSIFKSSFSDITIMPLLVTISIVFIQNFVYQQREVLIHQQETRLAQIRTELLLGRMKPHFVYNALNAVYGLCDISAERAKAAIVMISDYIRSSRIDFDGRKLISFDAEMKNVDNYLAIEKMRFGDMLRVEYDIACADFAVPPLAVQALAENAVRHGIEKTENGGRVMILEREEADCHVITISDDGPGFSKEAATAFDMEQDAAGRRHIGLFSTIYRVQQLCGGTVQIRNGDTGAEVEIRIPADKGKDMGAGD